jgi:hypothetical protein
VAQLESKAAYLESLARDPFQTQLPALFLPYSVPILPAVGTTPMLAVMVVAGVRVIARARVDLR